MLLPQRAAILVVADIVVAGIVVAGLGGSTLPAQARLVLHQGQWMRKYDVEKLKYADYMRDHGYVHYSGRWRRQAEVEEIQEQARRELGRLGSSRAKPRDRDRDRRDAVTRDAVTRRTVTLGIGLQHTELIGLETVPVSLGVGAPVRIQLPRTRSVSIGTTVTVPAGIGR